MHTSKVTHLNEITLSNFNQLRVVESGRDLAPRDQWEPLDAVEVGVFDGRDSCVGEQLLGGVVDELSVKDREGHLSGGGTTILRRFK